jgi:hypothetical protein
MIIFFLFLKYQPQALVIGKVTVQPIAENKELVFHSQVSASGAAHPDQPCNKSTEM